MFFIFEQEHMVVIQFILFMYHQMWFISLYILLFLSCLIFTHPDPTTHKFKCLTKMTLTQHWKTLKPLATTEYAKYELNSKEFTLPLLAIIIILMK